MANTIISADDTAANALAVTGAAPVSSISATPAAQAGSRSRKEMRNDEGGAADDAIVRCMKAWNYAYKKESADLDEGEDDYPAEKAANEAYLRDAPPLNGLKNICEFIACINF